MIDNEINEHISVMQNLDKEMIQTISEVTWKTLQNGNRVFLFGNGGSAGDAQHIAAELTGRFKVERRGLPGVALTTDTSAITAIGNDYGFERIFDRQLEALASKGDLAIGISTSGNSDNVINAINYANDNGIDTVGFLGKDGGQLGSLCQYPLVVDSNNTARIQEAHIFIGHTICSYIDSQFTR